MLCTTQTTVTKLQQAMQSQATCTYLAVTLPALEAGAALPLLLLGTGLPETSIPEMPTLNAVTPS